MELGLELAFYSLDRESSKQTSEEAKEVLESFELQIFDKSDFEYFNKILNEKYCKHTNWRVRHQAIYTSGLLATKMCMDVNYNQIAHDVYIYIYDEELRIWWMAVVLFENIFNILKNKIWEQAIAEYITKVEISKKDYKDDHVTLHGAISVLIAILYSASYDIPLWAPSLITFLAKFRQGYGLVSIDVTKSLSWFKK